MEYAQILNGRVHWRFADGLTIEELGQKKYNLNQIHVVDVTGLAPLPEEGWTYADGVFAPPVEPEPTPEEIQKYLVGAVQNFMDAQAQARGYDNIFTAVTYADEPAVSKFQAEGAEFRRWRSVVWAFCYDWLADVLAGTRPVPTAEELIAALPALELP